jgi:hypothetical protein
LLRLAADRKDNEKNEHVREREPGHSDGDIRGESSGE